METIVFADVEALVVSRLASLLDNTAVATAVPKTRPTRFVKVTAVGGNKIRINADQAMVLVQCWDAKSVDASSLARMARAHLHSMEGDTVAGTWIYKVTDVGAPASNPDPNTNTPRYQFTVMIQSKGEVL